MELFKIFGSIALKGLPAVKDDLDKAAKEGKKYQKETEKSTKETEKFGESAKAAGKKLAAFSASMGKAFGKGVVKFAKAGAAAVAGVATAIGGVAVASVTAGAKWESAFAQVQTIMDSTAVSTADMEKSILKLSSSMGIASDELANTVYNVISATGDTANAVSIAEQASKLATAGFTDSASALSVLTTAMNAYGLSADQVGNISDSLIMVQNLGVTTVAELSSSMGKAIASAAAYGVDLGNVEAAYVSLTKAGINTAESTTYMSAMFKELGDNNTEVSKILTEKTGKSFDQLMKDGNTLADVLGILQASVNGDSTALMNLWSSAEAGKASASIVNQGLTEFNDNLKAIEGSSGATETAFSTMADTLEHKISVLKTTGTNFLTALSSGMGGGVGGIVEYATQLLGGFQQAFESGGSLGLAESVGTAISDLASKAAEYAPKLIEFGTTLINSLISGLSANSESIAQSAATIVSQLISGFMSSWSQMIPLLGQFIVGAIESLLGMLPGLLTQLVSEAIPALLDTVIAITEAVSAALPDLLPLLIGAIASLIVLLCEKLPEMVQPIIDNLPQIISSIIVAIVANLPKILWAIIKFIGTALLQTGQIIWNIIVSIWETIKGIFQLIGPWIYENVIQPVIEFFRPIIDVIGNIFSTLWSVIRGVWIAVSSWFNTNVVQPVVQFFQNLWSSISALWSTVASWFDTNVIQPIVQFFAPIVETISTFFSDLWADIQGVWQTVSSWFNENVISPLSEFFNGLLEGVVSAINWCIGALNSLPGVNIPVISAGGVVTAGGAGAGPVAKPLAGGVTHGSHASGLDYVPFDGYIAELHRGEMVVPAEQAQTLRGSTASARTGEIESILLRILDELQAGRETRISINNREFGRLVRGAV